MGVLTFTQVDNVLINNVQTDSEQTSSVQTNSTQIDDMSQLTVNPNLGPIIIRTGGYSARFKPAGSHYSKPVKQWFKQWKVAPWLRDAVLLVIQNEQVLGLLIEGCWKIADKGDIKSVNALHWLIKVDHCASI
jgi:tRNA(Ile)-lysidine synthase